MYFKWLIIIMLVVFMLFASPRSGITLAPGQPEPLPPLGVGELRFAVAVDARDFTTGPNSFVAAVAALASLGHTNFLLTPGDMDPPQAVRAALDSIMGTSYRWYPVIGNHELPGEGSETAPGANLAWLRAWPTAYGYPRTRSGPAPCPETTYSFDIGQVHFVALNVYCDTAGDSATVGDIPDLLYNWLAQDLAATRQPYIIVLGHEPAYPQPDAMVGGSARHLGDSLDAYPTNRDRFWELLEQYRVTAYLTGHTHGYSVFQRDGVWQVDAGHARGLGDVSTPSTFLVFTVGPTSVTMRTYRADYLEEGANAAYRLVYSLVLEGHEVNLAPACH